MLILRGFLIYYRLKTGYFEGVNHQNTIMHISSFGVLVSLIAYLIFPQHVFAQIPKEDNKQIVFNIQNEIVVMDGLFVVNKQASEIIKLPETPVIKDHALISINDPSTPATEPTTKNENKDKKPKPRTNTMALAKKTISTPTGTPEIPKKNGPVVITPGKEYQVVATAYSSTVDQTDNSPFITASGTHVHDGTLAANFLKFGTKVTIPDIYGDRIFTVEDRMRDNHKVDVWFSSREQALKFGVKRTRIVLVN